MLKIIALKVNLERPCLIPLPGGDGLVNRIVQKALAEALRMVYPKRSSDR